MARPVEIIDYVGTPHVVGSVKQPISYTEMSSFDRKAYLKTKDEKRLKKLKKH